MRLGSSMFAESGISERNGYLAVGGLVLFMHLALLYFWFVLREPMHLETGQNVVVAEILATHSQPALTEAAPPAVQHQSVPLAQPMPRPLPSADRAERVAPAEPASPAQEPAEAVSQKAAAPAVMPQASVLPDIEPDYKAAYLNNPRPTYPPAARRMELQGRVMLNVEVLTDGLCGRIQVLKSSGHEMLDNAALQTVKKWRFVPARHAGMAVVKWCQVPIKFALGESEI